MSTSKKSITLTEGPIVRTLLMLAFPIMASSFLSTIYSIVDMAWVGTLGAKAVAGVGVGGMYTWFSAGISTLPRMGGQVLTAQSIGSKEFDDARDYAKAAIQMVFTFGCIFAVLALLFTNQMVGFFHLNDAIAENCALSYIRVTCGLILFSFLNVTLSGLYTAQGDSRTPLVANFFGVLLNIILDPMFIMGLLFFPKLGALGAAIATVSSQALVTFVLILYMKSRGGLLFHKQNYLKLASGKYFRKIFRIGLPASIQSTVYCFISMILSRMVTSFGAEAIAVMRVGNQIEAITWNTADGFSSALNAFCGQNFGAKRLDRIRKGYNFSLISTFGWASIVMLIFIFAPALITSFFFHEPEVIAISINYFMILGLSEPFMAVEIITGGALSGLGKTKVNSIISITLTALRIPLAFFLKGTSLGLNGIWWALTITSVIKGIVFTIVFKIWCRRNSK